MAASAVFKRRRTVLPQLLVICAAAAGLSLLGLIGCTVWGAKQPNTFKNTTSAEQYERIFWAQVRSRNWQVASSVLAPNIVYTADGNVFARNGIVPYLEARKMSDFAISEMVVKPNGPDMTVSYTLQVTLPEGKMKSLTELSVWQHLHGGWIMIAHSEQPKALTASLP